MRLPWTATSQYPVSFLLSALQFIMCVGVCVCKTVSSTKIVTPLWVYIQCLYLVPSDHLVYERIGGLASTQGEGESSFTSVESPRLCLCSLPWGDTLLNGVYWRGEVSLAPRQLQQRPRELRKVAKCRGWKVSGAEDHRPCGYPRGEELTRWAQGPRKVT